MYLKSTAALFCAIGLIVGMSAAASNLYPHAGIFEAVIDGVPYSSQGFELDCALKNGGAYCELSGLAEVSDMMLPPQTRIKSLTLIPVAPGKYKVRIKYLRAGDERPAVATIEDGQGEMTDKGGTVLFLSAKGRLEIK